MRVMPSTTRYFDTANRYLGWGEPDRGLWFIGLEEASEWSKSDLEHYTDILTPFFSYRHFNNGDADLVTKELERWGVSLP